MQLGDSTNVVQYVITKHTPPALKTRPLQLGVQVAPQKPRLLECYMFQGSINMTQKLENHQTIATRYVLTVDH